MIARAASSAVYRIVLPICWLLLIGSAVLAQQPIDRLPTVDNFPTASQSEQLPLYTPTSLPPTATYPDQFEQWPPWEQEIPPRLPSHKDGFFQRLSFSATWLEGGRVADVGITELDLYATFALPAPTPDHPLLVTPGFETAFLHGPLTPDLPPAVYSAYLQMLWIPRITERWTGIFGVNPGVYSDFQDGGNDAFRLLGRAVAKYDWHGDRLQLLLGVLYLDRDDVNLLPTGGVVWRPSDDVQFDLLFPQPKIGYRLSCSDRHEDWLYLAGEFGGDSWAISRAGGARDRVTMRDLRLILGIERKLWGGSGLRLEVGYVFGRTFEYNSATPDLDLGDTVMLRGGVMY